MMSIEVSLKTLSNLLDNSFEAKIRQICSLKLFLEQTLIRHLDVHSNK